MQVKNGGVTRLFAKRIDILRHMDNIGSEAILFHKFRNGRMSRVRSAMIKIQNTLIARLKDTLGQGAHVTRR